MSAVPPRAARYLRVSTARQAEHDLSIPAQRKQGLLRRARAADIGIEGHNPGAVHDRRAMDHQDEGIRTSVSYNRLRLGRSYAASRAGGNVLP